LAESGITPPDHLQQEMSRLLRDDNGIGNADTVGNGAGEYEEEDVTEFDYSALGPEADPFDEDNNMDMDWAEGFSFPLTQNYE
jgi:hypothetical protein